MDEPSLLNPWKKHKREANSLRFRHGFLDMTSKTQVTIGKKKTELKNWYIKGHYHE